MTEPTKSYFSDKELNCPCCGFAGFNAGTLVKFNAMREAADFPIPMSSGYRCPAYNAKMGYTQSHSTGHCGDVVVSHKQAFTLLALAPKLGFTGIGVQQKGSKRFLHFDDLVELLPKRPRPHLWSY